jgi:hypothetical protein
MTKIESNFFHLEPEDFPKLDLTIYSDTALREMAYFLWSAFPEETSILQWRKEKLLPLLSIDDMIYDYDEED